MLETNYILEIPLSHRKEYGQFFTPSSVAHLMARWVMKDNPQSILDPAFGLGIFYDEIKKLSIKIYNLQDTKLTKVFLVTLILMVMQRILI